MMRPVSVIPGLLLLLAANLACGPPPAEPPPGASPEAAPPVAAAGDPTARDAARAVREGVAEIQEREDSANATGAGRDPLLEEQCADVSQSEMDAAEDKVSDLSGELVVLSGSEQLALTCSRYQKRLRGEM